MFQKLKQTNNGKIALVGLVLMILAIIAMGQISFAAQSKNPAVVSSGHFVLVDFKPFESAEEAYKIFNLYTLDVIGLVRLMYAADFLFLTSLCLLVFGLIGFTLKYLAKMEPWGWLVLRV